MNAQQPHDTIVSDLGRTRSIKRQEAGQLNQQPGLTYQKPQQYYNGFPRKAEAFTHQMNINKKQGWQRQDTMQMLSAPMVHFRQDHFFKSVREAVRFGQKAKMPVKQRCMYNNLNFFRPIQASEQMAMSHRENPVVKREGIRAKPLRGSDSVALKPAEEGYVNYMDEPMTEREIALLKRKALQNNPRVLSTIRRLHQLAVAIRENEPPANGNGDGGEPGGVPPAQAARSVSKPNEPTGDSGESKGDRNEVESDEDDSDDTRHVDPVAWVTAINQQLRDVKTDDKKEPPGNKVDAFILKQIPDAIRENYEALGDKSAWSLIDFVNGLESLVTDGKKVKVEREGGKTANRRTVVKKEREGEKDQERAVLKAALELIESDEFRSLEKSERSKQLREMNTVYELGVPRGGSASIVRSLKAKIAALNA